MNEQIDFEETAKQAHSQSPNTLISQAIKGVEEITDLKLLEISFSQNQPVPFIFKGVAGTHYNARFTVIKADEVLDFQNDLFHCCFTENTIYFWKTPILKFMEIHRVLKPGGKFLLSFIEKANGKNLPWTEPDFRFYEVNEVEKIFHEAGFATIEIKQMPHKDGENTQNPYVIISGYK